MFCEHCGKKRDNNSLKCRYCNNPHEKLQNFGNSNFLMKEQQYTSTNHTNDFSEENYNTLLQESVMMNIPRQTKRNRNVSRGVKLTLMLLICITFSVSGFLIHQAFNKSEPLYIIASSVKVEGRLIKRANGVIVKLAQPHNVSFDNKSHDTIYEVKIQDTTKAKPGDFVEVTGRIYREISGAQYTMLVDKIVVKK